MLYPPLQEFCIRFLDCVLVLIWIAGHIAAVRRNPPKARPENIPVNVYNPRHGS